ncbi:hypothetical protein NESM_000088600 [Novymonas esmeraldas]|uniref:Uncharacterized protein n=1 Tax=Novymonas esmeraldas TaxID=1808958 RepID=A0AAW0F1S7_9TRYP
MYSAELEWLLGGATASPHRQVAAVSAREHHSASASAQSTTTTPAAAAAAEVGTAATSRPCAPELYAGTVVVGALVPRGPRESADGFTAMPSRFL